MPRPQFAVMLVERRRQLGLSITQASQVLRLKEQVLVAFEEGNFERIPKSGYAQGMLSSYARYLGLNSRDVVRQFSRDLDEYLANNPGIDQAAESYGGGTGDVTRRQVAPFGTTPYIGSRGLLPTSGGLAGDMGAFATTSQPHSRLDGSGYMDQTSESGYSQRSGYGDQQGYDRRTSQGGGYGYGYQSSRSVSRYAEGPVYGTPMTYGADQVTTRRVSPSQYTDDLRYDDGASPYEAASTSAGRRSSRNIANTQRPNVRNRERMQGSQQRRPRGASGNGRRGSAGRDPRRGGGNGDGGIMGTLGSLLSGSNQGLIIFGIVAIVLTIVIILSVQSCVAGRSGAAEKQSTVPVTQTEATSSTTSATTAAQAEGTLEAQSTSSAQSGASSSTQGSSQSTSQTGTSSTASAVESITATGSKTNKTTAKETKVVVSVESGAVSWVDIQSDGESMVADTITGPWSETYDVHDSITIEVGDTTAVTVTENGSRRQFDSKTSGIGSITIQGTPDKTESSSKKGSTTDADTDEDADAEAGAEDDTSTSSSSKKKTTTDDSKDSESKEDSKTSSKSAFEASEDDEYLYDYNGYEIYYNEEHDLYYFYDEDGQLHDASNGALL